VVSGIPWRGKSEQSAKVFSAKIVFFTNPRKFSPSKVSCYMVCEEWRLPGCSLFIESLKSGTHFSIKTQGVAVREDEQLCKG